MLDLAVFYDPGNWTRRYWEYGEGYTIVRNRHIGLDIARSGRVPALVAGTVVDWADTQAMGRVILVDVGLKNGKYLSYCHMSKYDMPALGQRLQQGELFGRLATGPKSVGFGHANFPGYSWSGTHLHLVWHNKPGGAYLLNQKDTYNNPENLIREVLSTPAGLPTTPFDEEEEEEEMAIPNVITVGVPNAAGGPNTYWSMNIADHTIALLRNGTQLDFRRNLGIPEFLNQAPAIIEGYRRIDPS